jgi:hypothetical protein
MPRNLQTISPDLSQNIAFYFVMREIRQRFFFPPSQERIRLRAAMLEDKMPD